MIVPGCRLLTRPVRVGANRRHGVGPWHNSAPGPPNDIRRTWLLPLLLLLPAVVATQPPTYDLILRGGRIVDGTGSPWYRADIAISGDTIARIAPSITAPAARVIDVSGLVVAPGFIDIHTHARRGIFEVPTADNYVRQGVTTLIEGPDGSSPLPLAPFLDKVAATRSHAELRQLHRPGLDSQRR